MGVLVALEYLREGRPEPEALILVSGTACLGAGAAWFAGSTFVDVQKEAADRAGRLGLRESATPYAVASSWNYAQQADLRQLLPSIAIPTLVMHGREDEQCPISQGLFLATEIRGAEVDIWDFAGHNLMDYDKYRFVDSVRRFLIGLRPD